MNYVFFLVIFSGLYTFCSKRKHILLMLLSIEFMVLGFFFSILFSLSFSNLFFSLIFLTFTACEGALGLGVLINMSRVYGTDYFSVFNFNVYDN
uniref:NADH-ubiquinone oxidoreductase chain 4L n=1 Tax=Sminthurus viridis TaxID=109609 RepID=B2BS95_SMIVR|nr:NADH dehydrogenase subunit 4L [Sminthurus viridis]ABS82054.1 NADH dehydrogenase subunit 4L [Sminthurus viridis]